MRNLTISMPLGFDEDKFLRLYIPEPSFDRIKACLPVFRFVFHNKDSFSNSFTASKDFDILLGDILKDEVVKKNFNALIEEAILNTKIICITEQHKKFDEVGEPLVDTNGEFVYEITNIEYDKNFLEIYGDLDDDERSFYKVTLVFIIALLRYLPAKILKREASEFYTLLSFTDYKNSFLNSIEEVQVK